MGNFGLTQFRKVEKVEVKIDYIENILVGHDRYSINSAYKLLSANPELKLIVIREESSDLFNDDLTTVRGDENIKLVQDIELNTKEKEDSVFFKDLKFHSFKKRTKSEKLISSEPFFTQAALEVTDEIFTHTWQDLLNTYPQVKFIDVPVEKIISQEPSDLINQDFYKIELTNHQILSCKNLIWGHSPYAFLNKLSNKETLTDEFMSFCELTKGPTRLSVKLTLKEKSEAYSGKTLFIPLSYTHDWGHFIGEFLSETEVLFVHYQGEETLTKEDVEKRIRLFKRQLDKAFSKFSENILESKVKYEEESASLNIDDNIEIDKMPANLQFVGENSFLQNNTLSKVSNFTRGYLSIQNLTV